MRMVLATWVGVPVSIPDWAPDSVILISTTGRAGVFKADEASWLDPTEVESVDEVADAILPERLLDVAAEFCVVEGLDILTTKIRQSPY